MASIFNVLCYSLILIGIFSSGCFAAEANNHRPVTAQARLTTLDKQNIDLITLFYGERAGKRATAWRQTLHQLSGHDEKVKAQAPLVSDPEKLKGINDFFNQLQFIDDTVLWNETDYWATLVNLLVLVVVIVKTSVSLSIFRCCHWVSMTKSYD